MPRNYSINGKNTTASTTTQTTVIVLTGGTVARTFVFDITMGSTIAPADVSTIWDLKRYTAAGTSTAYTPVILDPGSGTAIAAASTAGVNASVEPTYSGTTDTVISLLVVPLNARATFRYVASPGAEFINTVASTNGLGLRQGATTTPTVGTATLLFFE